MMNLLQAINDRHSVRQYLDKPIEIDKANKLKAFIEDCNKEGKLHFQLILNEPKAFNSFMAHYGKFSNVKNYIALIGEKSKGMDEIIGYYGAKILIYAQSLGLNTCWVALTYKKVKTAFTVNKGEKIFSLISLGYGKTQGVPHKSKDIFDVSNIKDIQAPEWFKKGVETALLAPTAMNQQKFYFILNSDDSISAITKRGPYAKMDLGIVKYFFEVGASDKHVIWKKENK